MKSLASELAYAASVVDQSKSARRRLQQIAATARWKAKNPDKVREQAKRRRERMA